MKYSVVIPTYNHCDDLLRPCIEALMRYTDMSEVELIVSANGCQDNTWDYLQNLQAQYHSLGLHSNLKLSWSDKPLGYAGATNAGIRMATADKIILLSNDAFLLEQPRNQWISLFEAEFEKNPRCGIAAVLKIYSEHAERDFGIFFCVMIARAVFDRIGLITEKYGVGGCEDIEFCIETENAGFEVRQAGIQTWSPELQLYSGFFPIYHRGEATVHDTSLVSDYGSIFERNCMTLARKYNPKYFESHGLSTGMSSSIKYSIVIPTYNHCDDLLKPCIDSIFQYTDMSQIELIVSANGCVDNTREYLQTLENQFSELGLTDNFKIVWNENPMGYARATNAGIRVATAEHIVLLNNDTTLTEQPQNQWIELLKNEFDKNAKCGISCVQHYYHFIVERHFAIFFCVMISRKMFDIIGLLNEDYEVGGCEDVEFSIKIENAGFEVCQTLEGKHDQDHPTNTPLFPVHHQGQGTLSDPSLVSDYQLTIDTNVSKLVARYNPNSVLWAQKFPKEKLETETSFKKPLYSIVIPTYNHCDDFLRPCIESIFQYSDLNEIEIVVSANGCTDNTRDYLENLKKIMIAMNLESHLQVVWNDNPMGYARATNAGIQACSAEHIVLLNNDTVLLEQEKNDWLKLLKRQFDINPRCGISCVIKEYSPPTGVYFAVFFCVMISRKVFDRIGLLSEDYGVGAGEDTEFCIEAEKVGFEICESLEKFTDNTRQIYTGSFPIYHKGEGTLHDADLVEDFESVFTENSLRLANKYNPAWAESYQANQRGEIV